MARCHCGGAAGDRQRVRRLKERMSASRNLAAHVVVTLVLGAALIVPASTHSQSDQQGGLSAPELVAQLWQFPASLLGVAPSTGIPDPVEQRRRVVYD